MALFANISKKKYLVLVTAGLLTSVAIWSLLTYSGLVQPFFLPSPTQTIATLANLFMEEGLLQDLLVSYYRVFAGFILATVVAVPLGILLGTIKSVEAFLEPIIAFVRYIPPSAFVPLSILWLGISDVQKFSIIFLGVAPYLLILVADRVAHIRTEFIEAGLTLGATTRQLYSEIIVPATLPGIWDYLRLMFSVAWTFIVLAEIVAASSGVGHVLIQAQRFLKTESVIAVIFLIGLLGLLTDYLFRLGYRQFFPWSEKVR